MKLLFIPLVLSLLSCNHSVRPVYVEYFKPGQLLTPDYACSDTLIVLDARGLNEGMAMFEQGIIEGTDYQIDSVLHTFCIVK